MITKEFFSKFKDNSRTNCTFLEFKEFSRTKVIFKDFSRSVRTLFYVVQVRTASKLFYIDVVVTWSRVTGVLPRHQRFTKSSLCFCTGALKITQFIMIYCLKGLLTQLNNQSI